MNSDESETVQALTDDIQIDRRNLSEKLEPSIKGVKQLTAYFLKINFRIRHVSSLLQQNSLFFIFCEKNFNN